MSDARNRTFKTVAEYKATYYPHARDVAEASATAPQDVGKAIAEVSLEVIREAVVQGREPAPRLMSTKDTSFSDALSGMIRS